MVAFLTRLVVKLYCFIDYCLFSFALGNLSQALRQLITAGNAIIVKKSPHFKYLNLVGLLYFCIEDTRGGCLQPEMFRAAKVEHFKKLAFLVLQHILHRQFSISVGNYPQVQIKIFIRYHIFFLNYPLNIADRYFGFAEGLQLEIVVKLLWDPVMS